MLIMVKRLFAEMLFSLSQVNGKFMIKFKKTNKVFFCCFKYGNGTGVNRRLGS